MAWPLRRLPAVSFLINTTWNPRGSFRLFPWCRWPFAELPLSNKAPHIRSASLSLLLFLSGGVELSGSWRAESSAPVSPGGLQKTKRGLAAAVTLQRPQRKHEQLQISPFSQESSVDVLQPKLKKEKVSFFSKKREKSIFHAPVVKSSWDLLYSWKDPTPTVPFVYFFIPTSFLCTFLFPVCQALTQERTRLWTPQSHNT